MFDTKKEARYQVTPLVEMAFALALLGAVGAWGNDCLGTAGGNGVDQGFAVLGFVGRHGRGGHARQQRRGCAHVSRLPGGQAPAGEVAKSFDQRVELGGQAAARPTDGLLAVLFWAPAASAC